MDTDNRSRQKTVRFWEALIAAAATLQQAAHSETAVFEAFTTRLVQMNLQGGILKLDPIRNTLEISALAFPERLLNILNTINSLTGLTAFGYRLPLEQAPTYQDIIDKKETIFFVESTARVLQMMPPGKRMLLKPFMRFFSGNPTVLAPIIQNGAAWGLLYVTGPELRESDRPAVTAFAYHIAIALENAWQHQAVQRAEDALEQMNEQLNVSHEALRALIHQLPVGIQIFDVDGWCIDTNQAQVDIFGTKYGNIVGNYNIFRDPLAEQAGTSTAVAAVLRGDTVPLGDIVFEFENAQPDFARTWGNKIINVTLFPVFSETRQVVNFVGLNIDVTEQRQQELLQSVLYRIASIAHTEHSVADLYPAIHRILADIIDVENFYIALLDEHKSHIIPAYFVDEHDYQPDKRPLRNGLTEFVIRSNSPQLLLLHEIEALLAGGELELFGTLPQVWVGVPLQTQQETIGVLAVQNYHQKDAYNQQDLRILQFVSEQIATVIERKQADEKLRELAAALARQTQMTDAILATTPDLFMVLTPNGRYQYLSPTTKQFFHLDPATSVRGKDWQSLHIPAAIAKPIARDLQTVAQAGQAITQTIQLQQHGRLLDIEYVLTPVLDSADEITAVVSTMRDITQRKKEQEQLYHRQKVESLGVLAGGLAHDFNNLLVAMLGQTSLAVNKLDANHPVRTHIEKAVDAAQKASLLTQQMLAYSGRGRFHIQMIDLNDLIRDNAQMLDVTLPKTATLELALDTDLPPIAADAGQLQQIVMNLVLNGAEALREETGRVRIATGRRQITSDDQHYWQRTHLPLPPGEYLSLEVSDTGHGMAAETLDRIFDPFFTTKFTGRGLGLAAVLGIVRGHGGGLYVCSTHNNGTRFEILFPINKEAEQMTTPPYEAPGTTTPSARHGTVLVIDDEEAVRDAVNDILGLEGINVLKAANGRDGIALYTEQQGNIDLIILDLSMPGMRGDETLTQLLTVNPDVRVLLSSGYSEMEATRDINENNLVGYLQKPYRVDTLLAEIYRLLQKS